MKKEKYRIVKQVRKGFEEFSIEILYPVASACNPAHVGVWLALGDLNTQRYPTHLIYLLDDQQIAKRHEDRKIYSSEDDATQALNNYIDKLKEEYAEKQKPFYYWTPITEIEG